MFRLPRVKPHSFFISVKSHSFFIFHLHQPSFSRFDPNIASSLHYRCSHHLQNPTPSATTPFVETLHLDPLTTSHEIVRPGTKLSTAKIMPWHLGLCPDIEPPKPEMPTLESDCRRTNRRRPSSKPIRLRHWEEGESRSPWIPLKMRRLCA